jgi:polysaccharide export outer membrane protein
MLLSFAHSPAGCAKLAWLAIAVTVTAAGCSENRFYAATLPPEFGAKPIENMGAINLSNLAHYSTNSELIDRGDVLDVSIVTNYTTLASTTTPVRVMDNGVADVPLIGPVTVGGLEIEAAERAIAAAAVNRGIFQRPAVTVAMRKQRSNRVTVVGAVKQPGVYSLPRGSSSLLAALVAAGGLAEDSGSEVEIRASMPNPPPPGPANLPQPITVNLASPAGLSDRLHGVNDGDVVTVSKRAPKPVYVIGLVTKPGEYKMPVNQNLQVLDALALAGDRSMQLADKVIVIRRLPDRPEPVRIEVSVSEAKANGKANLVLSPGDIVSVEDTPVTMVTRAFMQIVRFSVGGGFTIF